MQFSSLTTPPTPSSSLFTHDCDNPRHPSPKTITKKSESSEVYSCPDAILIMSPTFSPTVVPTRNSTEGLEVTHDLTCAASLPPSLVALSLVGSLERNLSPTKSLVRPGSTAFSPPTSKRRPPQIDFDPDAIFGGDSDVDFYDYSDDDDDEKSSDYDPGPCSPRPLSQGQPTIEGLRAWQEERGLCIGQANHYMTTRPSITLLSEIEIHLNPSYPHFTPFNPATLGLASLGTSPPSPLITLTLPPPLPDYEWDSVGASSCESAEMACCSCEASCDPSVEKPDNPPYDLHYPLLDPSLDLEEVYPSISLERWPSPT